MATRRSMAIPQPVVRCSQNQQKRMMGGGGHAKPVYTGFEAKVRGIAPEDEHVSYFVLIVDFDRIGVCFTRF